MTKGTWITKGITSKVHHAPESVRKTYILSVELYANTPTYILKQYATGILHTYILHFHRVPPS